MGIIPLKIDIDIVLIIIIINVCILLIALFLIFRNYRTMEYLQKVYKKGGFIVALKEAFKSDTYLHPPTNIPLGLDKVDQWSQKKSVNLNQELKTIEQHLFGVHYIMKHAKKYVKKKKTIPIYHRSVGEHVLDKELKELSSRVHGYTTSYKKLIKTSEKYNELGGDLEDVNALLNKLGTKSKTKKVMPKITRTNSKSGRSRLDRELDVLNARIGGYEKHYKKYVKRKEKLSTLRNNLDDVDEKILNLNIKLNIKKIPVKKVQSHKRVGQVRSVPLNRKGISKELSQINMLLKKGEKNSSNIIGKIKQKVAKNSSKEKVESLAVNLVRKISKRIEGDQPVRPNELLWIQKELSKVQKKIKKKQ